MDRAEHSEDDDCTLMETSGVLKALLFLREQILIKHYLQKRGLWKACLYMMVVSDEVFSKTVSRLNSSSGYRKNTPSHTAFLWDLNLWIFFWGLVPFLLCPFFLPSFFLLCMPKSSLPPFMFFWEFQLICLHPFFLHQFPLFALPLLQSSFLLLLNPLLNFLYIFFQARTLVSFIPGWLDGLGEVSSNPCYGSSGI